MCVTNVFAAFLVSVDVTKSDVNVKLVAILSVCTVLRRLTLRRLCCSADDMPVPGGRCSRLFIHDAPSLSGR